MLKQTWNILLVIGSEAMPKKSKYNLHVFAHLKVPKFMYEKAVEEFGEEDWAEGVRDIIRDVLFFKKKVKK